MKKLIALALIVMLVLSFSSCGLQEKLEDKIQGGIKGALEEALDGLKSNDDDESSDEVGSSSTTDGNSDSSDNDTGSGDASNAVDGIIQEAFESGYFTEASAVQALGLKGLSKKAVEPDWDYTIDESKYTTYGDSGRGQIEFIRANGEISDEEYEAWVKKLFDTTAKISDDGYNIQGWSFGDGEIEKTWEEVDLSSYLLTWSYKYNGTIIDVYPQRGEDPEQETEYYQDESGSWVWVNHYKSVAVDVSEGLQKSWDDTWSDLETYFEENEDEIRDALEDAFGE